MISLVDGFFEESGCIQAHTFDGVTGEYLGEREMHVSQGCGLPAGTTLREPPIVSEHQVAVWRQDTWVLVPDFRGLVFRTSDGAQETHSMPGELPPELTTLPRPSAAYVWGGINWVLDVELDLEFKTLRERTWIESELREAGREIEKHQDADSTAIGTEADWRKYRIELRAWPDNGAFPDADKRPQPPAS
jgi:hypothetical protein